MPALPTAEMCMSKHIVESYDQVQSTLDSAVAQMGGWSKTSYGKRFTRCCGEIRGWPRPS